jgi:BlaI family penicillinase repressor
VQESLEQDRPTGYTTALKLLQIMFEKGLVQRDESERTHVYRARASERQTQRLLLRDLADRAFAGSIVDLVQQALAVKPPTRVEAAEIRRHLRPSDDPQPGGRAAGPEPAAGGGDEDPDHPGRLF